MADILTPSSGDFDAWSIEHPVCIAVDWDGTCKDTMVPKWTRGFNLAIPRIWPALQPFQKAIDEVCYDVNIVDEPTAGVQRFVALKVMMGRWNGMGLPVPDLSPFFQAVEAVQARGEKHGIETYRRLQDEFGYDDSPLRWSDLSDEFIAESTRDTPMFANCREALAAIAPSADLVVVSASKTEAVRRDLIKEGMADLFKALLAQDFLPKAGILRGLAERYLRVLFIGDTQHDARAGAAARVPVCLVEVGREAASWRRAARVLSRFVAGEDKLAEVIWP